MFIVQYFAFIVNGFVGYGVVYIAGEILLLT